MTDAQFDTLKTLTSVRSELEANEIVNILQSHGIQAKSVGGFTSQFQTGAPGKVDVLVMEDSFNEAQGLLREYERLNDRVGDDEDDMQDSVDAEDDTGNRDPWFLLLANLAGLIGIMLYWTMGGRSNSGYFFAFATFAVIVIAIRWVNRRNQESEDA